MLGIPPYLGGQYGHKKLILTHLSDLCSLSTHKFKELLDPGNKNLLEKNCSQIKKRTDPPPKYGLGLKCTIYKVSANINIGRFWPKK